MPREHGHRSRHVGAMKGPRSAALTVDRSPADIRAPRTNGSSARRPARRGSASCLPHRQCSVNTQGVDGSFTHLSRTFWRMSRRENNKMHSSSFEEGCSGLGGLSGMLRLDRAPRKGWRNRKMQVKKPRGRVFEARFLILPLSVIFRYEEEEEENEVGPQSKSFWLSKEKFYSRGNVFHRKTGSRNKMRRGRREEGRGLGREPGEAHAQT